MKRFVWMLLFFAIGVAAGIAYVSFQNKSHDLKSQSLPKADFSMPSNKAIAKPVTTSVKAPVRAYVAIVLDDWGYNTAALDELAGLKNPVTVAVLPDLPYSRTVADTAIQSGHEVILHMPMEPKSGENMEPLTLVNSMDASTIRNTLQQALATVPHVRGISNHTGSAFTENPEGMQVVLNEVLRSGLYFFDSMVTAGTVGYDLSIQMNLPTAKRDIFLDNVRDIPSITTQLQSLARKALKQGSAIGIGHDEEVTLEAIRRIIPEWNRQGIGLVTLGDLIHMRQKKSSVDQQFQSLVSDL